MSIASEITRIENAKSSLRSALIGQGQSVEQNATIDTYAPKVISIPNADTIIDGSATSITCNATTIRRYAFYYYDTLISANFPNATSIGDFIFDGCSALASVSFGSATSIGETLRGLDSLSSVNVPELSNVAMDGFNGCVSLVNIVLPKVERIETRAFANCSALKTITLGYKVIDEKEGTVDTNYYCQLTDILAIPSGQNIIVYVPAELLTSYQNDTNWSSLVQAGDITFSAIV